EQALRKDGVELLTGHQATRFYQQQEQWLLDCKHTDSIRAVAFDQALIAVGRAPNTRDLDAEALGIQLARNGAIVVDERMQSTLPGVYACGDVAGPYQFTHAAGHQAWYATSNALFAPFYRPKISYRVLPATTYTEPEVSRVGLNEQEAKAADTAYEVSRFPLAELDRAVAENLTEGFVKILTVPGKDRILGCTIVGANAGELIAEQALAMQQGLGLGKILGTIHAYPGWAEANKLAAGAWRRAHTPTWLGPILRRYHRLRR
ncbi:MAG TPA: NAD(P)/FAD-dependent oxidoreductase, partial [Gammaproteobacteria bacterium]|nr:NAD(P)/FAD-dependent oxidoreductase [Gammaproteobacteria bacterium]